MVGSRVCGEYGDSPPIQPRITALTANRIYSLVKQHPARKLRSAASLLGFALPCLAMPGPASLSQPPLHSPVFPKLFLGSRRPEDSARLWASLVGLSPGVPFRSRNPHRSLCDKAAPPFLMQAHTRSQGDAEFAPSVPGATAGSGMLEFWEIGSRLHRGEEGVLQIAIWQNGLTRVVLGCASTCFLWQNLLADMDTAAGL